jgi:hypothetical protein
MAMDGVFELVSGWGVWLCFGLESRGTPLPLCFFVYSTVLWACVVLLVGFGVVFGGFCMLKMVVAVVGGVLVWCLVMFFGDGGKKL